MEYVSQGKALEQLGFINNDTRYDNSKKRFTEIDSEMFYEICERHVDIERPTHEKQKSKSVKQFKIDKDVERFRIFVTEQYDRGKVFNSNKFINSSMKIFNDINNILNSSWIIYLFAEEELREIRKKNKEEQLEIFANRLVETSARNIQYGEEDIESDSSHSESKKAKNEENIDYF